MAWTFKLLYVYILTLGSIVSGENTYCRFPDLQAFPIPFNFPTINTDDYNSNCLQYPSFNATIQQGSLIVQGCASNAEYRINSLTDWQLYKTPVPLSKGQSVRVRCDNGNVLLVNPPMPEKQEGPTSKNPSVFVVMVDAVSYEALHRIMPHTVEMLKDVSDVNVFEFTKYLFWNTTKKEEKYTTLHYTFLDSILCIPLLDWTQIQTNLLCLVGMNTAETWKKILQHLNLGGYPHKHTQ